MSPDNSYSMWVIYLLTVYTVLNLIYFITKRSLKSVNVLYWFIVTLSGLLYNYTLLGSEIYFRNYSIFINFDNITLFSNTVGWSLSFVLNPLSYSFSLLVIIIGFSTNIYILNYFKGEADESGFIFWINSFIISMLVLVFSNNFFTLFLGWELIGFTSFFLINFWQGRRGTLKSSFKAFSFNLVSDLCLLGSLVIFYQLTSSSSINTVLYLLAWSGYYDDSLVNIAIGLLIICASIKSVQLVGHLWLPDSMEAPVPASALIHSATLVSAGIFLLARFNTILVLYNWLDVLAVLGSVTAAYGGIVASAQTDMKKLLAYSTMSHCGFLMVLVSFSNFYILIIYLFLHGLFKAATFFCAGSFIRIFGSQDTRLMGGAQSLFLADSALLILCSINLCGLPLTIGVLYKTLFMKVFLYNKLMCYTAGFLLIGLLTSIIYFYRLVYYSLFDIPKWTSLNIYENLQVNKLRRNGEEGISLANKIHVVAVSILVGFSLLLYIIFFWFTQYNILDFGVMIYNNFISAYIYTKLTILYEIYFIYFYTFYLFIITLLYVITYRWQFIWWTKLITVSWVLFISLISVFVNLVLI